MRKNSSQLEKSLASWTKTLSVLVWFHDLWLNLQPIHNSNKTDSFGGHQQRLEFQLFLTETGPKMDYALNIVRKTISFRNGDLQRHFLQTLVYLMHWASTSSINQGRKTNNLEDIVTLNNLTRTLVTQFYAPSITLRWPLKSNYSTKPSAAKHEKELHQYFVFQPAIALTQAVWISGSTQESVRHSRSIKFDSSQEISVSSKAFYDDHPSRRLTHLEYQR